MDRQAQLADKLAAIKDRTNQPSVLETLEMITRTRPPQPSLLGKPVGIPSVMEDPQPQPQPQPGIQQSQQENTPMTAMPSSPTATTQLNTMHNNNYVNEQLLSIKM